MINIIIRIITIHAMHNPGSVLQAYALEKYLEKIGETKIIDYRPDYFYSEGNKLKLIIKKVFFFRSYYERNKRFNDFISRNMVLTERYKSFDELCDNNFKADYFVVGSDQLWNTDFPCGNDFSFYLKFINGGKKVSYSTSVGKKIIDQKNIEVLKENLRDFDYLSVREKSTSIELTKLLDKKVSWVCDPVFLLTNDEYKTFINDKRIIKDRYILVYLSPKSDVLDSIVNYYRNKKYKVILCGGLTKRCYCDKHIKNAGPIDFLNLIYYADIVVSTSFHATAFCHIFHKEFVSIIPPKNGERIISLLEQTGLSNRSIQEKFDFNLVDKSIDWVAVDEKVNEYVDNSRKYLNYVFSNSNYKKE